MKKNNSILLIGLLISLFFIASITPSSSLLKKESGCTQKESLDEKSDHQERMSWEIMPHQFFSSF